MNLLITGSRDWKDKQIIEVILRGIYDVVDLRDEPVHIIHGDCKGADTIAAKVAESINRDNKQLRLSDIIVHAYPADWDEGKKAGPIRNQKMVDLGIDVAFAFNNDLKNSSGTRDCVERLKKAGVPTYLISRIS